MSAAAELSGQCGQRVLFRAQFRKTRLCRFYEIGQCSKGRSCPFAHGSDEMQTAPDLTKTSICRAWRQKQCPLSASRCPFAHGASELRKTDLYAESNNWKLLDDQEDDLCPFVELNMTNKGVLDDRDAWIPRNETTRVACEELIQPQLINYQGVALPDQNFTDLKRETEAVPMMYTIQPPSGGVQQSVGVLPWRASEYDKLPPLTQFMLGLSGLPAEKLEPLLTQAMPHCYED